VDSNLFNIEEYYNEVKDLYPDITLAQFSDICRTPFKFVKQVISSGTLENIRLQYFGVFEVSDSRVKYNRKILEENFKKGIISEDRYIKKKKILDNYETK